MTVHVAMPGATKVGWIGTGVMGGMISATVLAVLFVPAFFVVVQNFENWRKAKKGKTKPTGQNPAPKA